GASEQHAHVVARLTLVQQLPKHLHARAGRLAGVVDADNLDLVAYLHHATLDTTRHHRATTRDRKHVLHRHQEITVNGALRLRYVTVHLLDQLHHRRDTDLRGVALERLQRRTGHDRRVVAREFVGRQKVTHLHRDQLQQLRVVHLVRLVQVHHDVGNPYLPRQQDVLPRLRQRAVRRAHHQDRTVHLGRSRDHVLHVVRVSRAVNVRVVTVLTLVFHVRRRNRYAAR